MTNLVKKIKNFKNEKFDNDFLEELNKTNLIKENECFGDNLDTAMCVNIVEIDNHKYYICDGFEWIDVTDNPNDVIEWFDNDYECENDECFEKKEKILKELQFFLKESEQEEKI